MYAYYNSLTPFSSFMNPSPLGKIFIFASITVPILVYVVLPMAIERMSGKKIQSKKLLVIAGLLFFISWYLPSPYIQNEYTAFTTHFIGGGIFTGFVWLFVRKNLGWRLSLFQEIGMLYFLVSGLGVANELFELSVVQAGLARLDAGDTWWDLLANTLGAALFYFSYKIFRLWKR